MLSSTYSSDGHGVGQCGVIAMERAGCQCGGYRPQSGCQGQNSVLRCSAAMALVPTLLSGMRSELTNYLQDVV